MNTVGDLKLLPVWVNPDHLITSARILLAGHGLRALAVVEHEKLVGVLTPSRLAEAPEDGHVREFMLPPTHSIEIGASIREVADVMHKQDLDYVAVSDQGKFAGFVTATMLLPLLGRTWDPLTGLAWSDQLREWGVEQLRAGHEVTIVFIDLDDFGLYNKMFGHVVGDRVLQRVANMLREVVDAESEVLVRYAGDEFSIGTLRGKENSQKLADDIQRKAAGLFVSGTDHAVTFSVGVFGGRRSKERESTHYAATLDSLINLASKDSLARKEASKAARRALQEAPHQIEVETQASTITQVAGKGRSIVVVDVGADDRSSSPLTPVMLAKGDQVVSGVQTKQGVPLIESVVLAAAKALERLIADFRFHLDEVRLGEQPDGSRMVLVSGRVEMNEREYGVSAVRTVEKDLYFAAAEATVDAVLSAEPLREL